MNNLPLLLRKIDLFGKSLIFEEKLAQNFHTVAGNILTVVILIASTTVGFMFGKEVYERKTPILINSQEQITTSRIESKSYLILFAFSTRGGTNFKDYDKYLDVVTTVSSFDLKLSITGYYIYGLKKCNHYDYDEIYGKIVKKQLEIAVVNNMEVWCLNTDSYYIQNPFVFANSTFLNVRFGICNPLVRSCPEDLEEKTKDLYVVYGTIETLLDPNDYNDPIKYYWETKSQQVSNMFLKRNYISVERAKITTNRGWLLDNVVETEYFTKRNIRQDINSVLGTEILHLTFESSLIRSKTQRSYMNIQDVFAKIGGLFNAFLILGRIIITNYVDFAYYLQIFHYLKVESAGNSNYLTQIGKKRVAQLILSLEDSQRYDKILKKNSEDKFDNSEIKKNEIKDFQDNEIQAKNINGNNKQTESKDKLNSNVVKKAMKLNSDKQNLRFDFKKNIDNPMNDGNKLVNDSEGISANVNMNVNHSFNNTNSKLLNNNYLKLPSLAIREVNYDDKLQNPEAFKTLNENHEDNGENRGKIIENNDFKDYDNSMLKGNNYYSGFIWNDYICCRKTQLKKIDFIRKILSYNNIIKISFSNYMETNKLI